MDNGERYLDLMKRVLINTIYLKHEPEVKHEDWVVANRFVERMHLRSNGMDFPAFAHTMIGMGRLNRLHQCVGEVIRDSVPGDFVECGV